MLTALYNLKSCHREYTEAVDRIVLNWSYLRIVRDGRLSGAVATPSETRVYPENRLGYEEYAARGFELWGFEVERSTFGGQYQTAPVEGFNVPTARIRPDVNAEVKFTVSNPFVRYGLEFGFSPQIRQLFEPIRRAQTSRYRRTGTHTAGGTTASERPPYIVNSTVIAAGQPWATLADNGTPVPDRPTVSTATAFAIHALYPKDAYAAELLQATSDLSQPSQGYYEGFYEKTNTPVQAFTSSTNSIILQSLLYAMTNQQPVVSSTNNMDSPWWRAIKSGDLSRGLPITATQKARVQADASGTYWATTNPTQIALTPSPSPVPTQPTQTATPTPSSQPPAPRVATNLPRLTLDADIVAAQIAWKYFERNWNPQTGLVNAVDNYQWGTLWDQGSAILGIHAASQLGLIGKEQFASRIDRLLQTLEKLPLPATRLPNKAYSTTTAQMRKLDNTPDPKGTSGWSVLDTARFLMALHVLKTQYPEYSDTVNRIVARWDLSKLVKDGFLYGGIPGSNGKIITVQEGRLGYEQYAAYNLKLWNLEATKALKNPPVKTIQVEGIPLQVDLRNRSNSGASNYLTNDPYLLWGLELGWPDSVKPQVLNLLQAQIRRFERTGILTAVNEDSLDRPPYFLYYNVYADGQSWQAINTRGQSYPNLRFLSTKAAFAWSALMTNEPYTTKLRNAVQNLGQQNRGYFSGRYEKSQMGVNNAIDVNTNGIILESLLYKARGGVPLAKRERK